MKHTHAFHTDLAKLRSQYGDSEYSRQDILPAVAGLLKKHGATHDALLHEAASAVLDAVEKSEDKADESTPTLFPDDAHAALGDGKRIKRCKMTMGHCLRRKGIIDANKAAQDKAWALETSWLNERITALSERPPTTTVGDIFVQPAAA